MSSIGRREATGWFSSMMRCVGLSDREGTGWRGDESVPSNFELMASLSCMSCSIRQDLL